MQQFLNTGTNFNLQDAFKFTDLTSGVRKHLVNVYACLAATTLAATAGTFLHLFYGFGSPMLMLLGIGVIFWLISTPNTPENLQKRVSLLMGFGLLQGLGIGPLVEQVLNLDPSIVLTALLGTLAIFVSFSLAAVLAKRRSYLFLGGILSSGLTFMMMLNLMNMFMRNTAVFDATLYFGLAIFCGFVIFDTQMIIEQASAGDSDYVRHALKLFQDMIAIFIRLLIILAKMKGNNNNNKDKSSSRRR